MPVFIQNSLDGFYWGLATLSCSCRAYSGSLCLPKTSGGLPDSFVLLLTAELVPWIWLEDDLQPELMTDRFCRSPGHIWGVCCCHCARATYTDEYFRLIAQCCYFALQVPHRVTHAFWWAWLQTRGKLSIIFALWRETTLWCRDLLNNTRGSSFFHAVPLLLPHHSAAGAVCAERVHPIGAGSGGLWVQTLLPASAGPCWELPVHPAGAHRWAHAHFCCLVHYWAE